MALIPTPATPMKKGFLKSLMDEIILQIKEIIRKKDLSIVKRLFVEGQKLAKLPGKTENSDIRPLFLNWVTTPEPNELP